jgi:hypothetical protein
VGDGKVRRKNRHGIAENQVFVPVEDSFLIFGEMVEAEETGPSVSSRSAHLCRTAPDSSGVVLEADREPSAEKGSLPDGLKRFIAL